MLGTVSTLTVTGFIVTPRTLGARVRLTEQQLAVYHQHDTEVAVPGPQQQQTQHSRNSNSKKRSAGSDRAKPNLASCRASLIRSETVSTGSCLLVRISPLLC